MKFLEFVQWILAATGAGAAGFSYFLNKKMEREKLRLDKLKAKFDYLLIERNKVLSTLNIRVSNIELWMRNTKRLDDYDCLNMDKFRELLSLLEISLIHGKFLLTAEIFVSVNNFFEALMECIKIYDDEYAKFQNEPVYLPPEITFSNMLYAPTINELINTVKQQIGKELSD